MMKGALEVLSEGWGLVFVSIVASLVFLKVFLYTFRGPEERFPEEFSKKLDNS